MGTTHTVPPLLIRLKGLLTRTPREELPPAAGALPSPAEERFAEASVGAKPARWFFKRTWRW